MLKLLRPATVMLALMTLLTGVVYPLAVTGLAQAAFAHQANGSLLAAGDSVVGSELIGQPTESPDLFWSRPSATAPFPYSAAASSGSNLGPTNVALLEATQSRLDALRQADPGNTQPVPVDLVTASASGLDPHISVAAALYQAPRVARARGLAPDRVKALVLSRVEDRQFGFLGEPRVNVLLLNRALAELK